METIGHGWIVFVGLIVGLLQGAICIMQRMLIDRIDKFCAENEREHRDIWARIHHHYHTENGDVIVPRDSSE